MRDSMSAELTFENKRGSSICSSRTRDFARDGSVFNQPRFKLPGLWCHLHSTGGIAFFCISSTYLCKFLFKNAGDLFLMNEVKAHF